MPATRVGIVFDEHAIRLDMASPARPVGRAMSLLADRAVLTMKALCPVAPHDRPETARWPARASGTLRSSIRKFRLPDGSYLIGPTDKLPDGTFLAELISKGTPAHPIDAAGPWSLHNPVTGQYFGPHVNHPGTRPNPFIRLTAEQLHGARVRTR